MTGHAQGLTGWLALYRIRVTARAWMPGADSAVETIRSLAKMDAQIAQGIDRL